MEAIFFKSIIEVDKMLFQWINKGIQWPILDQIMPWMRYSNNWLPFYFLLIAFLLYKLGWKAWKWVLLALVNVGITDQVSSHFFKPFFHRIRPCNDPEMLGNVRLLLDQCAGGFSFTSSHAANHFGLAMFLFCSFHPKHSKYTGLFFIWAGLIGFAQIYVGVHYPFDVLVGSIIGMLSGYGIATIYKRWQGAIQL